MGSPADAAIRRQVPEDAAPLRDVIGRAFDTHPEVVALEEALALRSDSTGYVALVDDRLVGHVRLTRGWIDAEARLVEVPCPSSTSTRRPRRRGDGFWAPTAAPSCRPTPTRCAA